MRKRVTGRAVVHRIRPRRCSAPYTRGSTSRRRARGPVCPGSRRHRDGKTRTAFLRYLFNLSPSNHGTTPAINHLVDNNHYRAVDLDLYSGQSTPFPAANTPSQEHVYQKRDHRFAESSATTRRSPCQTLVYH